MPALSNARQRGLLQHPVVCYDIPKEVGKDVDNLGWIDDCPGKPLVCPGVGGYQIPERKDQQEHNGGQIAEVVSMINWCI
eukprot:365611-Chlamydomonas_euryale.AAC.2